MVSKNIIKRSLWFFLIITLIVPIKLGALKLSFKLSYGISYSAVGDTNNYLQSFFISNSLSKPFNYLHFGGDLSGEIYLQLKPRINIFVGSGIISASLKNSQSNRYKMVYSFDNSIKAIPLILGIRYDLTSDRSKTSLPSKLIVYLKAGVGYYFTTWDMTSDYSFYYYRTKKVQTANANNFGANGSIGVEIKLSKMFSLIFEAAGRYLKVDNYQGEYRYSRSYYDYPDLPIKDTLYYYEYYNNQDNLWLTELKILGKPVGNGVRNVRPAAVDFSGFSICFGFKINL